MTTVLPATWLRTSTVPPWPVVAPGLLLMTVTHPGRALVAPLSGHFPHHEAPAPASTDPQSGPGWFTVTVTKVQPSSLERSSHWPLDMSVGPVSTYGGATPADICPGSTRGAGPSVLSSPVSVWGPSDALCPTWAPRPPAQTGRRPEASHPDGGHGSEPSRLHSTLGRGATGPCVRATVWTGLEVALCVPSRDNTEAGKCLKLMELFNYSKILFNWLWQERDKLLRYRKQRKKMAKLPKVSEGT